MDNIRKAVSIIGTVGIPANYGGFETLTEHLVLNADENIVYTVYCSSKAYNEKSKTYYGAQLKYINLKANGYQSVIYDVISLFKSRKSDVILVLGTSGCIILPLLKKISKSKIIVNVDGVEWRRNKWNFLIKKFLKISEKIAIKYADEIVADNQGICDLLHDNYNVNSELIAYGGSHVFKKKLTESLINDFSFLNKSYAFKVCRIEPENNVEIILEAYSELNDELVIIGNWQNSDFGKQLFHRFSAFNNIHMLDPIYESDKLNQIRSNCSIYIHGHSAGGTNPSLVEAMSLGLPIICFDVNFNRFTTNNKALYFSDKENLKQMILNSKGYNLIEISKNLQNIANEQYDWGLIAKQYKKLFFK
jgi:glycosyltransferase involved in cell wall biosynthesis